ncbi:MAG: ATP-binding cassette domain-containing protein [Xanthobacteraceae bacterium]
MLQIDNLTFDAWGRRFFNGASVTIPDGTKVGLVGRNGVGKSTLFKLIVGELAAQEGDILLPKAAKIGSVDQEHPATPVSLLDTILAADTQREALNAQLETAEPEHLAEIYQQWRWPRLCSPSPICSCSTSRPITSISKARCGSRRG